MSAILSDKKYFFLCWDRLKGQIQKKILILFLDFDGTLAPIAQTPDKVVVAEETRHLLQKLLITLRCRIAVVSGRRLSDLKQKVNLPYIVYVGNHGYEIDGSDFDFSSLVSVSTNEVINYIGENLKYRLAHIPGVLIEDKEVTLSLHYRLIDKKSLKSLKEIFNDICQPYINDNQIMVKQGKMVMEVRPSGVWDKGKAVLWLLNKWKRILGEDNVFPVYIGDDTTDEDAFKVLREAGITIKVGSGENTSAEYYLERQEEVNQLLTLLLETAA